MNQSSGETSKAVDLRVALARMGSDETLLGELAELFCMESPKLLAALREAAAKNDAKAVRATAHSLKGSLGVFAAQQAAQNAGRLEDLANAGADSAVLAESVATLERDIEKVRAELQTLFKGAGVSSDTI